LAIILDIQKTSKTCGGVSIFNFEKNQKNLKKYDEVTPFDGTRPVWYLILKNILSQIFFSIFDTNTLFLVKIK